MLCTNTCPQNVQYLYSKTCQACGPSCTFTHQHVILICTAHGANNNYMLDSSILGQVDLGLLPKPVNLKSMPSISKRHNVRNAGRFSDANLQFLACHLLQSTSQASVLRLASASSLGQHWLHCIQTAQVLKASLHLVLLQCQLGTETRCMKEGLLT